MKEDKQKIHGHTIRRLENYLVIARLFNSGADVKQIANQTSLSNTTIINYLHKIKNLAL